jgi:hypothetical protein
MKTTVASRLRSQLARGWNTYPFRETRQYGRCSAAISIHYSKAIFAVKMSQTLDIAIVKLSISRARADYRHSCCSACKPLTLSRKPRRFELCQVVHAHLWLAQGSASWFRAIGAPSNAAPYGYRSRRGACGLYRLIERS